MNWHRWKRLGKTGILLVLFGVLVTSAEVNPVEMPIPFEIGGNVVKGPAYPWGMLSQPQNGLTNTSGTGCLMRGNMFEITAGVEGQSGQRKRLAEGPLGYYREKSNGLIVEHTLTSRAVIMKMYLQGEQTEDIWIDINMSNASRGDRIFPDTSMILSDTEIAGRNLAGPRNGICNKGYFLASLYSKLSRSPSQMEPYFRKHGKGDANDSTDVGVKALYEDFGLGDTLYLKTSLSWVSVENARLNLESEIPDWDFGTVREKVLAEWKKRLSVIQIEGGTEAQQRYFYTMLYRNMTHPNIFSDVNGDYPAFRHANDGIHLGEISRAEGYDHRTVFGLWDIYRTTLPLYVLIYPDVQVEVVKTMLNMFDDRGALPQWEIWGNEAGIAGGDNPSAITIGDTYIKGIRNYDTTHALLAMMESQDKLCEGRHRVNEEGVQCEDCLTASDCNECGLSAFSILQMADKLGVDDGLEKHQKSTQCYEHHFQPDGWIYSGFGYEEGSHKDYSFNYPWAIESIKDKMGGEQEFISKLNEQVHDEYSISNEPLMLHPFLFNHVDGQAHQTQRKVREIIERDSENYTGYPGEEDTGALSAWFLWAMMGLYPAQLGQPLYEIVSPVFDRVEIKLDNNYWPGESFVIETVNNSKENIYIQSATLNGQPYEHARISHWEMIKGGKLVLQMGSEPSDWGRGDPQISEPPLSLQQKFSGNGNQSPAIQLMIQGIQAGEDGYDLQGKKLIFPR